MAFLCFLCFLCDLIKIRGISVPLIFILILSVATKICEICVTL